MRHQVASFDQLNTHLSLAQAFPIADRYFCSLLGQTDPNRRYLISATSIGQVDDTLPNESDYPANGTIFDKLDAQGISWRDYYTTLPTVLLYPELYIKNHGTKVIPIGQFFTDAAAGTLPGFCLVEPDYGNQSEENPQNIAAGEQFAAQVINAVITGPGWGKTLLIWNYDEHGGYFDHVPPPPAIAPDNIPPAVPAGQSAYNGFHQYGFRVPSRWSPPGPARITCRTGCSTTPASARWWRPSGTCRRSPTGMPTRTTCWTCWTCGTRRS